MPAVPSRPPARTRCSRAPATRTPGGCWTPCPTRRDTPTAACARSPAACRSWPRPRTPARSPTAARAPTRPAGRTGPSWSPAPPATPRSPAADRVSDPSRLPRVARPASGGERTAQLLDQVGLAGALGRRYPHELSGGQRQGVSLARALSAGPSLLVADEPTSALDVSVQASVLNLIGRLQAELGFACLFVTPYLASVEFLAPRVAVMYLGVLVEVADRASLFATPLHPYTQALLSAAPIPDPPAQRTRRRIVLTGDIPSPIDPPPGCRFHTRCPVAVADCAVTVPPLRPVGPSGTLVACHLVADDGTGPRLV